MSSISDLVGSRELLYNLTQREIRGKYKRTALGQLWSLVNPIAQMLTYTVVFGFFLRNDPGPGDPSGLHVFALWLCAGLLPWIYLNNVINQGMLSLSANSNLILKVYFPRETLVVATVASWLFTHAIEMGVLVVAILLFGGDPLLFLPGVIFFMLVLTAFGLGLALILSIANVYFRDTQHFMSIFMQLWFYMTPILYPIALVESHLKKHPWLWKAYQLNPAEKFTVVFRNLLYDNRWPSLFNTAYLVVVSAVVLVVGQLIFGRFSVKIAEEL